MAEAGCIKGSMGRQIRYQVIKGNHLDGEGHLRFCDAVLLAVSNSGDTGILRTS
jgi:hypothetical protein